MNKFIEVGFVSQVQGKIIRINTYEKSNNQTYFVDGETYQGCTVGSFIGIISNQYKIVARVEKEYLIDSYDNKFDDRGDVYYSLDRFKREIEVTLIGYFVNKKFTLGIRQYPQIYNKVVLIDNNEIIAIFTGQYSDNNNVLYIGKTVSENISLPIEWGNLFNTHIGIFGNTGSGKSNTLAKLFYTLFSNEDLKLKKISKFVIIDFNGEYVKPKVLSEKKAKYDLTTHKRIEDIKCKLPIKSDYFLNVETLSVLFSATEQTQKPFLERMLNYYGKNIISQDIDLLKDDLANGFINVFIGSYKKESKNLFSGITDIIKGDNKITLHFDDIEWHNLGKDYIKPNTANHLIGDDISYIIDQAKIFKDQLNQLDVNIKSLSVIQKLIIYCNLQLIYGLRYGSVQFDFISPLINRISARSQDFEKIFEISEKDFYDDNFLYIISLKNCNQEIKRIVPLFLVKQIYETQKKNVKESIENTTHLIIDEAHNILSEKSSREAEIWKDYRLETFNEVIKEGRKFGFYLTICSQRPSDISSTIISQLHNYFIHRLVNDRDLSMIDNTISTLDSVSKGAIPTLAPGQTVITGTAFQIPQIIQVDILDEDKQPRSESANLEKIWI